MSTELISMIKSGNCKAGAILLALDKMHLWNFVEMYFLKAIDDKYSRMSPLLVTQVNKVLSSLAEYKRTHPVTFKELYEVSSNTRNFNENAIYGVIFFLMKCPEALKGIIKSIMNLDNIYASLMEILPLPSRIILKTVFSTFKVTSKFNKSLFEAVDKFIDKGQQLIKNVEVDDLNAIVQVLSPGISKLINSVDPFGIILPASTFVWYDAIKRVEENRLRIIPRWEKIIRRVLIVLAVIAVIVLIAKNNKEGFRNIHYLRIHPMRYQCPFT